MHIDDVERPRALDRRRVVYWASTGIIATVVLASALAFALVPTQREEFAHLGLPDWFIVELTIAKLLGVVALVLPATPPIVRQFAYFGFGLTIVSAVAHLSSGDPVWLVVPHAFFLACLVASYRSREALAERDPSPRRRSADAWTVIERGVAQARRRSARSGRRGRCRASASAITRRSTSSFRRRSPASDAVC